MNSRSPDRDISQREAVRLDQILKKGSPQTEKLISVDEALRQKPVAASAESRSKARVLFISQDTSLLNPTTQSLDGYLQLKDLFDEVHILILRTGIQAKNPVLRVDDRVWIYTASEKAWWRLKEGGTTLIERELVFANGFRPDLIVARDPFESGLVGKRLSEKYQKPLQIHVLNRYAGERTKYSASQNILRRFMPRYTIPAAVSVRADTDKVFAELERRFNIVDLRLLPIYEAYEEIIDASPSFNLADKYQPASFFFLYVGALTSHSAAYRTIDAVRFALKNPRLSLIILGDGPAKGEFEKRAQLLGISEKVIFESKIPDLVSYLKGAHILLAPDTDEAADKILLKAAAAGLPAVMAKTETREDYFAAAKAGLMCEKDDTQAFADTVNYLLNNANERQALGKAATEMVKRRFHNSLRDYQRAFRESIEETLLINPADEEEMVGD